MGCTSGKAIGEPMKHEGTVIQRSSVRMANEW